ncbi:MAG: succinate dehydrogenase, hydrophobic membrane anchor protein [Sphingomonadaceae bacterium]|uniref:succinate dehydrogenase, hydrophobic membrane anchor protein n=1 Tax=Thermaurantiacus sp. TaxID=2820283 RepID=UPI00298EDEA2|nr:succinate dehydrogenase, hydrophobic membrane anchor protein [Thermaurantiacus sp.]MCS6986711.1 succinate dehydrogenase, hydrophobic membrane anchor protein [Sphingomonadaceae bacterium]MDW8414026.1 succinate dehydrogenase, hydrophobic membrane anchor protein [Thermaurantiacus sp.]
MGPAARSGTDLKRVRGLGAAHAGVHHWWAQRVTAAANLLLGIWLVASLLWLPDFSRAAVVAWVGQPWVAVPLALLVGSATWHMRLGVQVMLEDYVRDEGLRRLLLILLDFYAVGVAAVGLFAVLKIAFGAADA